MALFPYIFMSTQMDEAFYLLKSKGGTLGILGCYTPVAPYKPRHDAAPAHLGQVPPALAVLERVWSLGPGDVDMAVERQQAAMQRLGIQCVRPRILRVGEAHAEIDRPGRASAKS